MPIGTLQSVELAGRTAYKSEDKITNDSAEKFIRGIIKRGHESVIEHYPLVFRINTGTPERLQYQILEMMEETTGIHHTLVDRYIYLSMNTRTLRDAKRRVDNSLTNDLIDYAKQTVPVLFEDMKTRPTWRYEVTTPSEEELLTLVPHEAAKHIYRMLKFITNRGVTHELVRHRLCAFTQESTRYCNYSKKGVVFIRPVFWDETFKSEAIGIAQDPLYACWTTASEECNHAYNYLINNGATPQEARDVLTNALKTEIIVTANAREWLNITSQRTSKDAHPQMRELMVPALDYFESDLPTIFQAAS